MIRLPLLLWAVVSLQASAQPVDNPPVKFAFYSSAWGENAVAGLRVVAENQQDFPIRLETISFVDAEAGAGLSVNLDLTVPAGKFAEKQMPYVDLLSDDECVTETMAENWKLVEISNYTLNPSVRSLIIEDTSAFRIYQCVRRVVTSWRDTARNEPHRYEEWVLYHFERRLDR